MTYEFKTLKVVVDEGVAVLSLNRPEKFNPLSMEMIDELREAFTALRVDPEVKVVMLTGEGKAFCAGGDVNGLLDGSIELDYVGGRTLGKTIMAMLGIEKPVVCAVNGIAAGGGAALVLASDVIYASEKAKFSEIYAKIGMFPDMANLWLLPRVVGPYKAKELSFTAEIIDANEMYRLGIAQKLFQPEELIPKTMDFCKKLATGPILSYKFTKTFIDRGWGMSLEQFYDLEALALEIVVQSEDVKEGCTAFLEKRKPIYKGK